MLCNCGLNKCPDCNSLHYSHSRGCLKETARCDMLIQDILQEPVIDAEAQHCADVQNERYASYGQGKVEPVIPDAALRDAVEAAEGAECQSEPQRIICNCGAGVCGGPCSCSKPVIPDAALKQEKVVEVTDRLIDRARENKALKAECERKVEILINALNKINKREMGTAGNIAGAALKEFSNGII